MKDIGHNRIGNCLRKYRKARGLTQGQVATILGLKSGTLISHWENGVCLPSTVNLFRLAAVYRTMVDALYIDMLRAFRQELAEREAATQR